MMKHTTIITVTVLGAVSLFPIVVPAQEPETFEQAREISARTQRAILLEFFRDE